MPMDGPDEGNLYFFPGEPPHSDGGVTSALWTLAATTAIGAAAGQYKALPCIESFLRILTTLGMLKHENTYKLRKMLE